MDERSLVLGREPNTGLTRDGEIIRLPDGWIVVPPGDAALTRRIKASGDYWVLKEVKGRKVFSRGVWADAKLVEQIKATLEAERANPAYEKRLQSQAKRREKVQAAYVENFTAAVEQFLNFHPQYEELGKQLAKRVSDHATPVGSGTVARTERIPIERRAEAAVIAWMRHQTTAYDSMKIARVAGQRREVRRQLAQRSHQLLERYRQGTARSANCPLWKALQMEVQPPTTESDL